MKQASSYLNPNNLRAPLNFKTIYISFFTSTSLCRFWFHPINNIFLTFSNNLLLTKTWVLLVCKNVCCTNLWICKVRKNKTRKDKGCEKINGFKVIHFRRIFHFSTPCKHQEISGFLMFLRGIEKEPWPEMG